MKISLLKKNTHKKSPSHGICADMRYLNEGDGEKEENEKASKKRKFGDIFPDEFPWNESKASLFFFFFAKAHIHHRWSRRERLSLGGVEIPLSNFSLAKSCISHVFTFHLYEQKTFIPSSEETFINSPKGNSDEYEVLLGS